MRIYLDHNATTPLRPEAVAAMQRALGEGFGNPSSVHWAGAEARRLVAEGRAAVAEAIGVAPETVVFTSSATESNNTVLRGAALRAAPGSGDEIITCGSEHPSILEALDALPVRATVLPVGRDGRLDPRVLADAISPRTLLVSVMWANNETGVVQPIEELASVASARGVPFHTDAVQALGKRPLGLARLPVDFASFAAHKLGGPKGIGALYVRPGAELTPLLRGGGQERRRRPGTENVPGIAGFGAACAAALRELGTRPARLAALRERLWAGIEAKIPDAHRNSAPELSLEHTLNVSFPGASGEALVSALDLEGIAVATGAACHAGSTEPSHVLVAMGLPAAIGTSALRFSLGCTTQPAEIERVLELLPGVVARVRAAGEVEA
jgi:cysteine desulfurase